MHDAWTYPGPGTWWHYELWIRDGGGLGGQVRVRHKILLSKTKRHVLYSEVDVLTSVMWPAKGWVHEALSPHSSDHSMRVFIIVLNDTVSWGVHSCN